MQQRRRRLKVTAISSIFKVEIALSSEDNQDILWLNAYHEWERK